MIFDFIKYTIIISIALTMFFIVIASSSAILPDSKWKCTDTRIINNKSRCIKYEMIDHDIR
jgi:hypothetical protein